MRIYLLYTNHLLFLTYFIHKIFVGWDVIEAAVWYFVGVETVGRSLEELEDIFSSPYPPRAKPKSVIALKQDGQIELVRNA